MTTSTTVDILYVHAWLIDNHMIVGVNSPSNMGSILTFLKHGAFIICLLKAVEKEGKYPHSNEPPTHGMAKMEDPL